MAGVGDRPRCARRLPLAAALLLPVGMGASSAAAQSLSATGLTFGAPVRTAEINASGEALFDSNVARTSRAGAAVRGIKPRDVRLRPTLEANIVLPLDDLVLSVNGSVGYDFYQRNSRLNRERLDLTGGAATKVSVCEIAVQSGIARAQNDLADLSIVPGDAETSSVNVRTLARASGSATCGGGRIRPTVFGEYRHSDNSAALRRIANFDAVSYGGGLRYTSPGFGIVTLLAGRSEFDYPDRRAALGTADAFNLTYGGVRLDRRLGARLQVNGQLTYVDVDIPGGGGQFNGLNWDAAAVLRASYRAQITLGASRILDASAGFNARLARISAYQGEFAYALSPLLRFTLAGARRERDFDVGLALTPGVLLTNDTIDDVTARLNYTLGTRASVNVSAGYQDREADVAIYSYSAYRTSVGLRIRL